MKKLVLILSSALVLSGCANEAAEAPAEPSAEPAETAVTEPQATPETQEGNGDPDAKPEDGVRYLDGTWTLRTNEEATDRSVTLLFDGTAGTVHVSNQNGDFVDAKIEPISTYADNPAGTDDAMRFAASGASDSYTGAYGTNLELYTSDMQWFTGTCAGEDYLFLRELGNGQSILDSQLLGDAAVTGDMGWVFVRRTDRTFPTAEENDSLKPKDRTFYAYCWLRDGNSAFLQEMNVYETEENWYGDPLHTMRAAYTDGEYSGCIWSYEDGEKAVTVRPGLVKATVNADGAITSLEEISYLGYGAYERN